MIFCIVSSIVLTIVLTIVLSDRIRSRTYTENSDQSALLFILSWTLASTAVYQWRTALHTTHIIRVHNKRKEYFCRIPLGRVCAGLIPVYLRRFSWPYSIAQNYARNYARNYLWHYTENHLLSKGSGCGLVPITSMRAECITVNY